MIAMPSPHRWGRLLDSIFGKSPRQRREDARPYRRRLLVEPLEDRRLLASLTFDATGLLHYTGDTASANALSVSLMKAMMTGTETYTLTDPSALITLTDPTGTFTVSADKHTVTGASATVTKIQIDLGGTANALTLGPTDAPIAALLATDTAPVSGDKATIASSLQVQGDLTIEGFGTDAFANGMTPISVSSTGIQNYQDALTLSSDVSLTSSSAANPLAPGIHLGSTVTGGSHALTVSAALAGVKFDDALSGLTHLLVTGPVDLNGTTVTTSAGQEYTGAVTLSADADLSDTAGGDITFDSTVDGAGFALKTDSTGLTTFDDSISNVTDLTVTGAADLNGGSVSTTGQQDYQGAVSLSADTTLTTTTATAPGIRFHSTVTGNSHALSITSTAAGSEFDDTISGLTTLTVAGPTNLKTTSVSSTGEQDYQGAVTLNSDTTLTSTAATTPGILFESTVTGNSHALTLVASAGGSEFDDTVSGVTDLTVTGAVDLNGGSVSSSGEQDYQGAVSLSADTTLTSTATTTPGIRFRSIVTGNSHALSLTATAAGSEFDDTVSGLTTLTVTGALDINSTAISSTGEQDYQGAVSLSADTTLTTTTATAPGIRFRSTVAGGTHALTLVASTAGSEFDDSVTGVTALTVTGAIDLNGGTVTTSGEQDYQGAATLSADATLTSTATTAPGIRFRSTIIGGGHTLTTTATVAGTEFDGTISGVTNLSVTGAATVNGGSVSTTGQQDYSGAVTLGADTTFTSTTATAPGIRFHSTIAGGGHALSLTATTAGSELDGAVSGMTNLTVTGPVDLNGGSVSTTGPQDYKGAVSLSADATLTSTTATTPGIRFESTVTGNSHALTASAPTGGVEFDGTISGVSKLTVAGAVDLNGVTITTTGSGQDYQGAVTLSANAVLKDTAAGDITFESSVTGATFDLSTDTTGLTSFAGPVSGVGALSTTGNTAFGSLAIVNAGSVNIGGTTDLNAASNPTGTPTIQTTGGQTYTKAVTLTADQILASTGNGTILFLSTIDSDSAATPRSLTTQTDGAATFDGIVGGTFALQNLTVEGFLLAGNGAANLNATGSPTIRTAGTQDYFNAVSLGADQVLLSAGGQTITFHGTVDSKAAGPQSLTTMTDGTVRFQGVVGGTFALQSLTTEGVTAATTRLTELDAMVAPGALTVRTVGPQKYLEAVSLGVDQMLVSNGTGNITFQSTVDSDGAMTPRSLITMTDGTVTFGGVVGAIPLKALLTEGFLAAVNGSTDLNGGSITTSGTATDGTGRTYSQEYANAVVLSSDNTLSSTVAGTTGTILFEKTVDSESTATPRALTVRTDGTAAFGDATFPAPNGIVGGIAPLLSLTLEGFSNPSLGIADLNAIGTPPGSTTIHTSGGGQDYKGMVVLSASAVLQDTTGPITFESSITGNTFDLSTNTTGLTSFAGPVSGVGALSTTGNAAFGMLAIVGAGTVSIGGTADLNAVASPAGTPTIQTTGAQTYTGAVTLTADQMLTSTGGGNIRFLSTIDSDAAATPRSLTTQTNGATTFGGVAGGTFALQNLVVEGFTLATSGVANLNATGAPTIRTAGTQDYFSPVALGAAQVLYGIGGKDISFHNTIDSQSTGAQALQTLTDGRVVFQGVVGLTFPLASLATTGFTTVSMTGTTELDAVFGGLVTIVTTGRQDYFNPVVMGPNQGLLSTAAGAITFHSTADAEAGTNPNLVVFTDGITMFDAPVGGLAPLNSLRTSGVSAASRGSTVLAGLSVTTNGSTVDPTTLQAYSQSYQNAIVLATTNVLTRTPGAGDATIIFGSTVNAMTPLAQSFDVVTPGTILFNGPVGNTGRLKTLELNPQSGISQPAAAPFNVQNLLLGTKTTPASGTFDFSKASNFIDVFAANVNGGISLRNTSPLLTIDNVLEVPIPNTITTGIVSGVATNGGDLNLVVSQDLRINQVIDTRRMGGGLGTISALVGQSPTKPVHITIAANLFAKQATFDGTHPVMGNQFNDIFNVAPSTVTPILVIGIPNIQLPGPGNELDLDLLPNLPGFQDAPTGTQLTAFPPPPGRPLDGSGFYTFSNRARLTYQNIGQLGQLNASAYSYLNSQGLPVIVAQITQGSVDANGNPVAAVAQLLNPLTPAQPAQNPFLFTPAANSPYPAAPPRVTFAFDRGGAVPDLIIAGGAGTAPLITVLDGTQLLSQNSAVLSQFYAFDPNYLGGVNLATGNLTGNGFDDIVVGMANGGDVVRSFAVSGPDTRDPSQPNRVFFSQLPAVQANGSPGSFNAFNGFPGGVQVAVAGASKPGEHGVIFVAPGPGLTAMVKTYDGATGSPLTTLTQPMLFPTAPGYTGGIVLSATNAFNGSAGSRALLVGMMSGGSAVDLYGFNSNVWTYMGQIDTAFPVPLPLQGKTTVTTGDFPNGVGSVAFGALGGTGTNAILVGSIRTHVADMLQFPNITTQVGTDVKTVATSFPIAFLNSEVQVAGIVNATSALPTIDVAPTITSNASTDRVISPGGSDILNFIVNSALHPGQLTVTAISSNQAVLPASAVLLSHVGNVYTLSILPPAGTNSGTSTITITVTDPLGANSTMQFNVIVDMAPTLAPITSTNTLSLPASQFPYNVALSASSAIGNPLTYTVNVTGDSLLYDMQQQHQFTGVGYFNFGAAAYVLHSNQSGPGAGGFYLIRPADGAVFAYDGSGNYAHSFANSSPMMTLGANVYTDPGLLVNARPPADYATLQAWEQQYQFTGVGYFSFGASAYVLHSNQSGAGMGGYYLIRPSDGALFAYDGSGSYAHTFANATPMTTLGTNLYSYPDVLINALAAPALYSQLYQVNQQYDLQVGSGGFATNLFGNQAKWLYSPILNQYGLHWYTLTVSAGESVLRAWQGYADSTVGAIVATFNTASVYNNPYLLTTATVLPNPAVNASISPTGMLSIDIPNSNYLGTFKVSVGVSDGLLSAARTLMVTSTDTAPTLAIQQGVTPLAADSTVSMAGSSFPLTVTADAGGKPVTTTAAVSSFDPLFSLQQRYRFQGLGYFNFGAPAYVLVGAGNNSFGNNLYLLKSDGGLYAYDGSGNYAHTFATSTPIANPGAGVYADISLLLNAQPAVDYAQLQSLQQQFQFQGLGSYTFGAPAYVLTSATKNSFGNQMYLLKADGGLYAYDGSGSYAHTFANGTPIATLDPNVSANPALLLNAKASPALYSQLYQLEQQLDLHVPPGGSHVAMPGNAGKLLSSPLANAYDTGSYSMVLSPDGTQALLYALNSNNAIPAGATPVAVLDPSVYVDPTLLTNARAPQAAIGVTANVSGGTVTINTPSGLAGTFQVTVSVSDGARTTSQTFQVQSTNAPPAVNAIAAQTVSRGGMPLQLALGSTNFQNGPLSYTATAVGYSAAYNLQQQYNFTGIGYFTAGGVTAYVLHSNVAGGVNGYYLMNSAGSIYAYDGSNNYASSFATSANRIADLGSGTYATPTLLTKAPAPTAPAAGISVSGGTLTVNVASVSVGTIFEVLVNGGDGSSTGHTSFLVTVTA
jgi:hypothetical protein